MNLKVVIVISRHTHLFLTLLSAYWQSMSQYRLGALVWIINGAISPLILMYVWMLVSRNNPLSLSDSQIIAYYLLSIVVLRLTQSWSMEDLGQKIKDGLMSIYLIKPANYEIFQISKDFSLKIIRLITLTPFIFIFSWIFASALEVINAHGIQLLLFLFACVLGYGINYYLQNIIGLLAFWLQNTYGASHLYFTANSLFNGQAVPFALMPATLQLIVIYLPFRYILSFPIEILIQDLSNQELFKGFIWGFLWLLIAMVLSKVIYSKGIKSYTSVGL